jgi:cysteine desulfurase
MNSRVYVDHAATTPLDPRVLEAMVEVYKTTWGNPSSIYMEGQAARKVLDGARHAVSNVLGASPKEITFTSGGTEADNFALRGAAFANRQHGKHIITTSIEHHAVLHTVEQLGKEGFEVTYLPVDDQGFVDLATLEQAMRDDTSLVSVMYANNEVGTIEPIAEIARLVKARNRHTIVHTDAVQAAGALDLDVSQLGVDMLSLAGHKFYGPKGVGILYVRSRTPLAPQMLGGGQERDRRAGTENVAGAVGFATALKLAYDEFDSRNSHSRSLRDLLWERIPTHIPGVTVTGPLDPTRRLSNNFSCCIHHIEGESVLLQMDLMGFSASSGSACTTGSIEPSHVLTAMGIPAETARGSLRLTVGKDNSVEDMVRLAGQLPAIIDRLRKLSPLIEHGASTVS